MPVTFEPLTPEHLPLLHRWLQEPHVRAFWDDGERTGEAVRAHDFQPGRDVPGFVFVVDGQRAGFIQRERVVPDHPFGPWRHPEGGTWGVDLLIGEPRLTGRGLGPEIIRAFKHTAGMDLALAALVIVLPLLLRQHDGHKPKRAPVDQPVDKPRR